MKKSRFSGKQVIGILKQHVWGEDRRSLPGAWDQCSDVLPVEAEIRWMNVSEAQRLKVLEDENRRLKLLVAELSLHG